MFANDCRRFFFHILRCIDPILCPVTSFTIKNTSLESLPGAEESNNFELYGTYRAEKEVLGMM